MVGLVGWWFGLVCFKNKKLLLAGLRRRWPCEEPRAGGQPDSPDCHLDSRRPMPLGSRPKPAVARSPRVLPHGSPARERLTRRGPVAALLYSARVSARANWWPVGSRSLGSWGYLGILVPWLGPTYRFPTLPHPRFEMCFFQNR